MALTFHNNPQLKQTLVDRLARHEELDNFRQGFLYWGKDDGVWRGCALGCSLYDPGEPRRRSQSNWHGEMERMFGIPAYLVRAEEVLFESLAPDEARTWPRRFIEAMPVGVDLTSLADQWGGFLKSRLTNQLDWTPLSEQLLKELRATAAADSVGAGAR